MILILGKGALGTCVHDKIPNSTLVGRDQFDLSNKEECNKLIDAYKPETIINTVAVNSTNDTWDILTTNFTSQVYLTLGFYQKMSAGHIINISSTSTYWPSYPGINTNRLIYNISKESLSNFGKHFNRAIIDDTKNVIVSTIELGKFNSKFNNFDGGMSVSDAADIVLNCLTHKLTSVSVIK